jgi:polyisoprenoid-binding protein YceI
VRAFVTGLLSTFGHNPTIAISDFEGEVYLNPDALEASTLRMVIHAASLEAVNDVSEKDIEDINRKMHDEVLESAFFPQIVYEGSGVSANKIGQGQYSIALNGGLTLHGITRSQPLSARVSLNPDVIRAAGDLTLRQSHYAIRPVSAAGGTIRLKDEVKLSFDICARKQS